MEIARATKEEKETQIINLRAFQSKHANETEECIEAT